MALDKLVDSFQLNEDLTSVATAIRTKGKTSADLSFPEGFVAAINDLSSAPVITETSNSAGGVTVTITAPT